MIRTVKSMLILLAVILSSSLNAQPSQEQFLDKKQKAIVRIASLTGKGDLLKLTEELNAGLDAGLTINQIKEVLMHVYAYAGFPRSIRGLQTFMLVVDERKSKGLVDEIGPEASEIRKDASKYLRGKAILEELSGVPEPNSKTGYAAFAPTIEIFLKEHLFADIFERDVLTYQERELATISTLSGISGVDPMLRSHFNLSLNVGLSPNQLQEFVEIIKDSIGQEETLEAQQVLDEVLAIKK